IVDNPDDLKNTVLCTKNHKKTSYISRISAVDKAVITSIPKLPIYNQFNQFKISLSKTMANFVVKFKKKNVNLYFEKDASSASESGFVMFEAIKKLEHLNSVNKFVIDKKSSSYEILRKQYKHDILKRFSFKHYYYLFMADHFISSELSNHVIATKIFDNLLSNKIKKTPLYFLQHGIMFAKPVENPQGRSFYKENQNNNLVKSDISSDLEALEFYKMGYDKQDLMKTGLPKLDNEYFNKNANK
ncbi:CDP-glycerol glycerophosphotransferase, partial [Mammaliicoccus sciuri]